jgi:hypothetical protein
MIDCEQIRVPEPGRTLFLASDSSLYSVPTDALWMAYEIDPDLLVLVQSSDPLTEGDCRMLAEMGIGAWNGRWRSEK